MGIVSNVLEESSSMTDTKESGNEEDSLDKSKLYSFFKDIGFGISQKGVRYIIEILCYCYSNDILTTGVLKDFYMDFAEKIYFDRLKMKWNIEDSLSYLVDKSPTRNDALLCSFFEEYKYTKVITPKTFLDTLINYVFVNHEYFDKK